MSFLTTDPGFLRFIHLETEVLTWQEVEVSLLRGALGKLWDQGFQTSHCPLWLSTFKIFKAELLLSFLDQARC